MQYRLWLLSMFGAISTLAQACNGVLNQAMVDKGMIMTAFEQTIELSINWFVYGL